MVVLLNSTAGGGNKEDLRDQILQILEKLGATARVEFARDGSHLAQLADEAVAGPDELIAAGGGDGTINAVASRLAGTKKILGVLPLGTLNHFAKDIGVPLTLEGSVANLVQGQVKVVDVGRVNDRIFINNSSLGLYPEMVRRRDKEQQEFKSGKWGAMIRAFFAALREYRYVRVRVRAGGKEFKRRTPFVFVGNNPYNLDTFGIGGRPSLSTGTLCFWVARGTGPWGIIRLGLRAICGTLRGARDFESHGGGEFEVKTRRSKLHVALDGETCEMNSPLLYRSWKDALRVQVPAEEAKT